MEEVWECWGDWVGEGGSASRVGEKGGGMVCGRVVCRGRYGGG